MKRILSLIIVGACITNVTTSLAANTKTPLDSKWTCTTNASSSSLPADQSADKQMKNAKSAADAFNFASTNCRDCTKITCETE